METISNIAGVASKAIWGENQKEPVSGETGDVKAGEPYDAGNIDSTGTAPTGASSNTASSLGPITDARPDEASKVVDTSKNGSGIGPITDARTGDAATGGLAYRPAAAATTEPANAVGANDSAAGATSSEVKDAGLPGTSGGESLATSHGVGAGATPNTPSNAEVKKDIESGKVQNERSTDATGSQASPAAQDLSSGKKNMNEASTSATGKEGKSGGAAEGTKEEGKHSKLGALKEKIKAKLHKDKS